MPNCLHDNCCILRPDIHRGNLFHGLQLLNCALRSQILGIIELMHHARPRLGMYARALHSVADDRVGGLERREHLLLPRGSA